MIKVLRHHVARSQRPEQAACSLYFCSVFTQ